MKHSSLSKKKSIAFVVNVDWFFYSHFKEIAKLAITKGHRVYLLTSNTGQKDDIERCGVNFIDIGLERSGKSFFNEVKYINSLYKELNIINPDVIEFITIKPVIYGAILSRLLREPEIYTYISGLGFMFGDNNKFAIGKWLIRNIIYPLSLRTKHINIIVENNEDLSIISHIAKRNRANIKVINGVGVDLKKYSFKKSNLNIIRIVMVSRLLKDKGIFEFVNIAESISANHSNVQFILVGDRDPNNPMSLTKDEVNEISKNSCINYLGRRSDIDIILSNSDLFLFPSYREGFPKVLMEAASCGLPSIAFDVAGCRDAIINNETGYLIPFKDEQLFHDKIEYLIKNKQEILRISRNARKYAEINFDANLISKNHFDELFKNVDIN